MRNISFSLTTQQIRERTKTVTRRLGWNNVKVGELLQACEKCQGLKKGQHPVKLCVIKVANLRAEPLSDLLTYANPIKEVAMEGFSGPPINGSALAFMEMFCTHNDCSPGDVITRIEFEYV